MDLKDLKMEEDNQQEDAPQQRSKATYGSETGLPPLVVVVQGGKGCGKTTLIKSLVKYYTGKNLRTVEGNITVRNSKNQRLTFIECDNSLNSLIDLSKVVDIAIVMIDASVGFELETFEYICMLKNHGYTSVFGVLTHMDNFPQNKSLSRLKKQIKKRFQREATDKAKLFYLYGMQSNLYPKIQMHNLARYLRVIKPIPLPFRSKHPYLLTDRFILHYDKSKTAPEEETVTVSFFGYIRGNHFNINSGVYINGLGDYKLHEIKIVEDPCPYETVEVNGIVKRSLKQKEKTLYAPCSNVNNIEYDRNEGYITIPEKFVVFTRRTEENNEIVHDEGVKMVREMQSSKLKEAKPYDDGEEEEAEVVDEEQSDSDNNEMELVSGVKYNEKKGAETHAKFSEKRKEAESNPHIKLNKLLQNFKLENKAQLYKEDETKILEREIYDSDEETKPDYIQTNKDSGFVFIKDANKNKKKSKHLKDDLPIDAPKYLAAPEFTLDFLIKNAKKNFVTCDYEEEKMDVDDEELSGDDSEKERKDKKKPSTGPKMKNNFFDDNPNEKENKNEDEGEEPVQEEKTPIAEDTINFYTPDYGFYPLGKYVRVDVKKIEAKYAKQFSSSKPLMLCSVDIHEQALSFMKVRLEKHLYYPKILKSQDPIIYSIGWRRFQTTALLCVEDKHRRLRSVKYTPKFTSCLAISYGPIMPVYLRIVAFQSTNPKLAHFRICATGDLLESNQSFEVVKKLKLIGEPYKIEKKTAFIRGMFNSSLEASRYIGAEIKTVSGIRGIIKKQENNGSHTLTDKDKSEENANHFEGGSFRATFEDRVLKSDIVYLRTWSQIPLTSYYNPILDYAK